MAMGSNSEDSNQQNITSENKPKKVEVRSRNEPFRARASTRIWNEQPSIDNPYIATSAFCHGYNLFELMEKRSFVDVFYLLFRGELPTAAEAKLLESLMVGLINPGPRHPATRAAMNVGVGKTDPLHILPIASGVLGGNYLGGGEIDEAMRFLRKHQKSEPEVFAESLIATKNAAFPGFGRRHGGVDLLAKGIAERLSSMDGAGSALLWGMKFADTLELHGCGWLVTGVAAAVFSDLGFQPRAGGALFQLLGAPGLVAHGLEVANKPITSMPYVSDSNYVIE